MQPINIFLADSAFLVREGIKSVISDFDHIQIVGESGRSEELRAKIQLSTPDLLVIDYSSASFFSIDDIRFVSEHYPDVKFLVITSEIHREEVLTVLEYGVTGFLLKECDKSEILSAIHAASKRDKFFCGKVLDIILDRNRDTSCDPTRLTDRESQVVQLMAEGKSTQDMATELSLSVHTIYTHRKNIMKKLGVTRAAEVILYAINTSMVGES